MQVGVDEDRLYRRLLPVSHGRIRLYAVGGLAAAYTELQVKDFAEWSPLRDWGPAAFPRAPKTCSSLHGTGLSGEFAAPWLRWMAQIRLGPAMTIFFYDDPKTLYHWPANVWQAVSQHTAKQHERVPDRRMAFGNLPAVRFKEFRPTVR